MISAFFDSIGQKKIDLCMEFTNIQGRLQRSYTDEDGKLNCMHVYYDGEDIRGIVHLKTESLTKFLDLYVTLQGQICNIFNKFDSFCGENFLIDVIYLNRNFESSGSESYPFVFNQIHFPWSSFEGCFLDIAYTLSITLRRSMNREVNLMYPFLVQEICYNELQFKNSVKQRFRSHQLIDAEYFIQNIELKTTDIIVGYIKILDAKIPLKRVIFGIEEVERSVNRYITVSSAILKVEILSGDICAGDETPFRVPLGPFHQLGLSSANIGNGISLRFYAVFKFEFSKEFSLITRQEIYLWKPIPSKFSEKLTLDCSDSRLAKMLDEKIISI